MRVSLGRLTLLIPLYHSSRFADIIYDTINGHLAAGASILLSDRHQIDDFAIELRQRYVNQSKVTVITASDNLDWVQNINLLIAAVRTDFFRILPHDDSTTPIASLALLQALDADASAIVATGIVRAIDLNNQRIPAKDKMQPRPSYVDEQWGYTKALDFFFKGYYPGAFKGVIRTQCIQQFDLTIRPTSTLIDSERCWLFGLHLLGPFCFVELDAIYKRHYPESTHRRWQREASNHLDNGDTLIAYCHQLLNDKQLINMAEKHIRQNSFLRYQSDLQGLPVSTYYRDFIAALI